MPVYWSRFQRFLNKLHIILTAHAWSGSGSADGANDTVIVKIMHLTLLDRFDGNDIYNIGFRKTTLLLSHEEMLVFNDPLGVEIVMLIQASNVEPECTLSQPLGGF